MKVIHLVAGDLDGGAARGAYWLHQGLKANGIDSYIINNGREKQIGDNSVLFLSKNKYAYVKSKFLSLIEYSFFKYFTKKGKKTFSLGRFGYNIINEQVFKDADIIHLHWINSGLLNIKDLNKISKPIIWTLRDMWPFTGGCHIALSCEKYKTGCGACPILGSTNHKDLTFSQIKRKVKYYPETITFVGISNWITETAKNSYLLNKYNIRMIPNNVNTENFLRIDKNLVRKKLGIKTQKKIILIGAGNITASYRGFNKLLGALDYLEKDNFLLLTFGNINGEVIQGFESINMGYVNNDYTLSEIYSSADVFVSPVLMESFGKTLVESLSCGTPVVCFDSTGPKDIVTHKVNGYKAKPYCEEDFANGILWVTHNENYESLVDASLERAKEFDSNIIARKYIDLYKKMIIQ